MHAVEDLVGHVIMDNVLFIVYIVSSSSTSCLSADAIPFSSSLNLMSDLTSHPMTHLRDGPFLTHLHLPYPSC